jgi:hypothetical protein
MSRAFLLEEMASWEDEAVGLPIKSLPPTFWGQLSYPFKELSGSME